MTVRNAIPSCPYFDILEVYLVPAVSRKLHIFRCTPGAEDWFQLLPPTLGGFHPKVQVTKGVRILWTTLRAARSMSCGLSVLAPTAGLQSLYARDWKLACIMLKIRYSDRESQYIFSLIAEVL